MSPPGCVLFDLDGTLVDTAPDMIDALNDLRSEVDLDPLPFEGLRNVVSQGAIGLLRAGMPECDEAQQERWRLAFLAHYGRRLVARSRLFAGMEAVLQAVEARGLPWGVVTNKPGALARPLLAELGLADRLACTVAGDDLERRKPDPAPLLHACALVGIDREQTVYIGDAEGDVVAAREAGCRSVVAAWGYIDAELTPAEWGGDHLADRPEALLAILFDHA